MRIESLLAKPNYITESWNDSKMLLIEQQVIRPWVRDVERYVVEAQLTADQIKQIFGATEKAAVAGGDSRTLVGKGIDAAKFIDKKVNELGAALKNAGPVKNMDAKFKELKTKISAENPDNKVVQAIQKVSDWAKANPGKASVAVTALTIAASMVGGPLGGAVGGFLARILKDLLQGADLSTAIGKSVKTAAYGAIAGWAMRGIGDWLEGMRADVVPYDRAPGLAELNVGLEKTLTAPGFQSVKTIGSMVIPADQVEQWSGVINAAKGGDIDSFNQLWEFTKSFDMKDYLETMNLTNAVMKEIALQNDAFLQNLTLANDVVTAVAQGSIAASDDDKTKFKVGNDVITPDSGAQPAKQESYYLQHRPLSEGQVYLLFNKIDQQQGLVMEGPMDLVKKGLGAAGKAASWVGKQTTEKITSAKLFASWKLEGSPTDSEELAKFLKGQGVSDDIVKQVYTDMKLPEPGSADSALTPAETWKYTNPTTGTEYEAGTTKDGQLIINFDGEWETVTDPEDSKAILAAKKGAQPAVDIKAVQAMIAKLPTDRKVRLVNYMKNQLKVA